VLTGILAFDGVFMKMVFTLVLGLALLFPAGAQAGECLSRNEIRKMIEQSFYSLYRWQNYWYGYYYDIDLELRIRRNGRMIVDFHKEDFLRGFCDRKRNNNLLIQFAAYLKGVDLIYVGKIRNGKADMLAAFGDASEKAGEAWHDFNREYGYRLNVKLRAGLLKSTSPRIIPDGKLHDYIRKSVILDKRRNLFKEGIVIGAPRKDDTLLLIASRDFENMFLLDLLSFSRDKEGQHGEVYAWNVYIYTENLAIKQKRIEKIDNIKKHVIDRLRNDHLVIDCDEC
jgi:hypothetical protein